MKNNQQIGNDFEYFLKEEGIFTKVDAVATKRVLAFQIAQAMQQRQFTKTSMATNMRTSRAAVNRLLDPRNTAVTLKTMELAAAALGKRLCVTLEDDDPERQPAFASKGLMEATGE
jgi:antitoxin HicB